LAIAAACTSVVAEYDQFRHQFIDIGECYGGDGTKRLAFIAGDDTMVWIRNLYQIFILRVHTVLTKRKTNTAMGAFISRDGRVP
jgi:hypothetical protein